MIQTLIRWRLAEVMARHKVLAKDLASFIGISDNALSSLKRADVMPRIDGERLEQICIGITTLSKIGEPVTPYDLIEYIPRRPEDDTVVPAGHNKKPRNGKRKAAQNQTEDINLRLVREVA